jgi:tetratricopeptide (TPR) repeat protein/tRNA A-37 threonylcarbamoyl transferase component Bud32
VTTPPPTDPLIGTTVSQYEIVAKLGGGGMGVVYKARDTKLGRLVALKFLPPQWSHDESAKQRFVREAQAASATNHRNICVIHNIEETADGRLFIVMAYYEGETLKQKLERGPLPIIEAIEIASEIADGLAKAHAQGVVHRDVKPGNLMVTEDGVKILDFGLAKFADALQLTVPGSTIGTVGYMSPEQARGEEADARSDVWALGIVMFEMLAGSVPFRGTYQEATFHAIKNEPLPSLRAARPDIPEALERIVLKALEKDPEKRFQSAREPARDLKPLQGRTVPVDLLTMEVPRPASAEAASLPHQPPPRRRRITTLIAMTTALLAAIMAGVYFWTSRPVVRIPVAVVPVANHTGNSELDQYRLALTASLIDELAESPNIRVVPYLRLVEMIRPFMSKDGDVSSNEAIQRIASESAAQFLVVPTLVYRDREARWLVEVQVRNPTTGTTIANYSTAPVTSTLSQQTSFRLMTAAASDIQQHFRTNGPGRSFTPRAASSRFRDSEGARKFADGLIRYDEMEYAAALEDFQEAARLDSQHLLAQVWLARLNLLLNHKNEAANAAQRARTLAADASNEVAALVEGVFAESQSDADAAEKHYRNLVVIKPDESWTYTELADFLKRRPDRNQPAIDAYHELLKVDPSYVRPHVELCQLYVRIGDRSLAQQEAQAAIAKYQAVGLPNGEAQALLCLGDAQRTQGTAGIAEARRNIGMARRLIERLDEPYSLSRVAFYQASVEYGARRLDDALRLFDEAATRSAAVGNRLTQATALMNLGVINYYLGHPTSTVDLYRRGREAFLELGDERRVAEVDVDIAALQIDHGDSSDQVIRTLRNARANLEKMGHFDFQLVAMQDEADTLRFAGRVEEARTLLRSALQIAREKQLANSIRGLRVALALADLQAGDYEPARATLQELVTQDGSDTAARIALGTVLTKMGDLAAAKPHFDEALKNATERRLDRLLPAVHAGLGELAYEARQPTVAVKHFDDAIASWTDPLPNASSVEARCYRGLQKSLLGQSGRPDLEAGIADARRARRVPLETVCRAQLARVDVLANLKDGAMAALREVPDESKDFTLGPELRAQIEYWRSRATTADPEESSLSDTRKRLETLRDSLPGPFREPFAARSDIAAILTPPAVRSHQ